MRLISGAFFNSSYHVILKVDFYCRVIYVFNFMPLKKVEALYESRKWTRKLSEVQPLPLRVMFHT